MKKVALVGRVNVGKSTLFNALVGKNISLVGETPALTRDYQEGLVDLFDLNFVLIDTPGFVTSKDTISQCTNKKLKHVISDCDVVLFVCSAKEIITSVDLEILKFIRSQNKTFICLVNKSDAKNFLNKNLSSFYETGIDLIFISAMNKNGFEELHEYLQGFIGENDQECTEDKNNKLSLVIAGKPNVGKSTLVNSLLGQDRVVVSDVPGTTRDFVSIDIDGTTIVDTAGISKKLSKRSDIERIAARRSLNNISSNAVVLIIFDASEGITKQDLLIVSEILERGNPVIIGVNKIDLLNEYSGLHARIVNEIHESIAQVKDIPVIIFSALNCKNVDKIISKAEYLRSLAKTKISTRNLNDYLKKMQANCPFSGKLKLKYITQTSVEPIRFLVFSNIDVAETYKRYIKNNISSYFKLSELPIRIEYRRNYNPYIDDQKNK